MIGAYLIDTVILKQFLGKDKWGEALTPRSVTIKARVEYKERVVQVAAQKFRTSGMRVLLSVRTIVSSDFSTRGTNTISYEDTVTVEGMEREILQINRVSDFSPRYMEVLLV